MLRRFASFIAAAFRGLWALVAPAVRPAQRPDETAITVPVATPAPDAVDGGAGEEAGPRRTARVALVYYFQLGKNEPVPDLGTMTATYAARRMAAQGGGGGDASTPPR